MKYWYNRMNLGTFLVAQLVRICLPMQGTRVQSLVREDSTCCGATRPVCCHYWDGALEPASHTHQAYTLQLLKPANPEPVLCNKRSHLKEQPKRRNQEQSPLIPTREKPAHGNEDPAQPGKKKKMNLKKIMLRKETNHKRPHTGWLSLHKTSRISKSTETKGDWGLPGAEGDLRNLE